MKHLAEFWWAYGGAIGSVLYLWYLIKRRGGDEPLPRRIIFASIPEHDPKSPDYDPGLLGRRLILVVLGLGLVGLFQLVVWFLSSR